MAPEPLLELLEGYCLSLKRVTFLVLCDAEAQLQAAAFEPQFKALCSQLQTGPTQCPNPRASGIWRPPFFSHQTRWTQLAGLPSAAGVQGTPLCTLGGRWGRPDRQTVVFTSAGSKAVDRLAKEYLKSPIRLRLTSFQEIGHNVEQVPL